MCLTTPLSHAKMPRYNLTLLVAYYKQSMTTLSPIQLSNSLRSRGMPVRTVAFLENQPHSVITTLDKIRKMGDIRCECPKRFMVVSVDFDSKF